MGPGAVFIPVKVPRSRVNASISSKTITCSADSSPASCCSSSASAKSARMNSSDSPTYLWPCVHVHAVMHMAICMTQRTCTHGHVHDPTHMTQRTCASAARVKSSSSLAHHLGPNSCTPYPVPPRLRIISGPLTHMCMYQACMHACTCMAGRTCSSSRAR